MSKHPLFAVWNSMMNRCYSPKSKAYPRYGGRGIYVCEEWHIVTNFISDNENRYAKRLSLDRINNNGPYSLENTRWASYEQQALNKGNNVVLEYDGRSQTMTEWAREAGLKTTTLQRRLKAGWPLEEALTSPLGTRL